MRRGLEAASSEAALIGTTHNLLKLWRSPSAEGGMGQGSVELGGACGLSEHAQRPVDVKSSNSAEGESPYVGGREQAYNSIGQAR